MAKNVLELNGKRYDAITGAYLGASTASKPVAAKKPVSRPTKGKAIDGFIRPTGVKTPLTKPAKPATIKQPKATPVAQPVISKPKTSAASKAHKTAVHAKAHKPEKSKTLMRRAVQKPHTTIKPLIKPQAPAEIAAKAASTLSKPSALQVDEARLERAQAVHKSQGIKHFQPVRPDYTPSAIESIPRPAAHIVPAFSVAQAPAIRPKLQATGNIFEAALARAESHKQPAHPHKKQHKHRGLVNTLAGVGAFLVIAGFIGYLNVSNIQLHIASVQAGFTASMPTYKPDGYAMKGGVQRIGDTVSMHFTAGENKYVVTQQPSDWNSQTLVDNTVALSNGTYKTVQAGGRTVYVYGGSNAVWVDGGIRYDVTTNAPLSTQDITQLAASL